jgi:hypothetical protein
MKEGLNEHCALAGAWADGTASNTKGHILADWWTHAVDCAWLARAPGVAVH